MDVLSESLGLMKIKGHVLLNEAYVTPWAVSIPNRDTLADIMKTDSNTHIAAFHLVQRGYIEIEWADGNKTIANTGDIVISFSGAAHTIFQGSNQDALPFMDIMQGLPHNFTPSHDNQAQSTALICGLFMLHNTSLNPLFEDLPAWSKISTATGENIASSSTTSIVNLLLNEIAQQALAHNYMIERYLELLCAKAIRSHLENTPTVEKGWLHALKDTTIVRSISLIHSQPAHGWSIKTLAQSVALSPSRFAARFTAVMGLSPMAYVTKWRIYLASLLLNDTQLSVEQVSSQIGYNNVTAFNRAFKRHTGLPPGTWRTKNQSRL